MRNAHHLLIIVFVLGAKYMTILGFKILKVKGHSMFPKIPQHSYILINQWLNFWRVKPDETVLINHEKLGLIIKTVALIDRYGFIWSKGENASSLSVERIGPVDKNQILGKVLMVIKQ